MYKLVEDVMRVCARECCAARPLLCFDCVGASLFVLESADKRRREKIS